MQKPAKRGMVARWQHWWDTKTDTLSYITENEAILVHNALLTLNPNYKPENKRQTYTPDDVWLTDEGYISKAIRRQVSLLTQVETGIFGATSWLGLLGTSPNPSNVSQIIATREKIEGYFSPHLLAVLAAYYDYRVMTNKNETDRCNALSLATTFGITQTMLVKKEDDKKEVKAEVGSYPEPMPYEEYCKMLTDDNPTYAEKINNAARKKFNPVKHLTHSKTQLFGNQLLRFAPNHAGHNSANWHFNPNLKLHQYNVEKVFEREKLLLWAIDGAIQNDDLTTIRALNFTNPDEPNAVALSPGYFSPMIKALLASYLVHKSKLLTGDLKTHEEQDLKRKLEEEQKKAMQEAAAKKKAEEEQEEQKRQQVLKEKEAAAAQNLEDEIQRRVALQLEEEKKRVEEQEKRKRLVAEKAEAIAKEMANKKRFEEAEKKAKEEAEVLFKASEEKKRAEREAALKALAAPDSDSNTPPAPTSNPESPAMPSQEIHKTAAIQKLEQNPQDLCACKSGKVYKNCCKKTTPSGSPQRP